MTNEQGQKWVHDLREHGQDDGLSWFVFIDDGKGGYIDYALHGSKIAEALYNHYKSTFDQKTESTAK